MSQPGAGYFTADTPRTKLFTGFIRGRTFRLGKVELAVGSTRLDWATVTMTVIDGQGFDGPGRILIAATGLVQEPRAPSFRTLDGKRITLADRWGEAPVLCEGIAADIVLPVPADRVTVHPLDSAGNRQSAIQATAKDRSSGHRHRPRLQNPLVRSRGPRRRMKGKQPWKAPASIRRQRQFSPQTEIARIACSS